MKRKLLIKQIALIFFLLFSIGRINAQGVFVSQNCDPHNNYVPDRFAEIYNSTDAAVDLTGWTLENVQNGTVQFTWTLSGTIASGKALVCGNADATNQTISPDFTATWVGNSFNGKGGDGTVLKNASGVVVDSAVQHDATGKFENGHMVRNPDIISPSVNYDASQWTFSAITNAADANPGEHTVNQAGPTAKDLFFSEYVEGSGSNRAIEIFNGTGADVDLSGYTVKQAHNGGGWGVAGSAYALPLSGTVASGDVYVIANVSADTAILAQADTTFDYSTDQGHKIPFFTGNDALGLFKADVLIDVVGVPTESSSWAVAGVAGATQDHTLVRKSTITQGDTVWATSAGTDADNSEWIVFAKDSLAGLGSHTFGEASTPPTWTTNYPKVTQIEDTRATLLVNMNEAGKAYYIVVASGASVPTSAEVKAGVDYGSTTVLQKDTVDVAAANTTVMANITGAQPNTSADIYVVAEDASGNLQSAPVKISVTTTAARSLTIDKPQANATFYLGDTIKIEWTSANIDSLMFSVYPSTPSGISVVFTTGPVAAADGSYNLVIPQNADAGNFRLVLWDAYDSSFKKEVSPITLTDNRILHLTVPKAGDSIYSGDSVVFRWTSAHVDSIYIGVRSNAHPQDSIFIITIKPGSDIDHPIPQAVAASQGYYGFHVPNDADGDTLTVYLFDASSNMQFYDSVRPVYLIDTTPPRIKSLTPPPGYKDFPASSGISVQFDSRIISGEGQLHVKKADGTTVADIPVANLHFWNSGNGGYSDGFSIWPNELNLVPGQSYYIEMDSALVKDTQGRPFAGLKGNYWSFTVASSTLYFSEYIEGSGNNKALEIYNPTDHMLSLDNYMIASSYNGSDVVTDSADLYYFPKGAELQAGAVFVLANSGASSDILKVTNDTLKYNEGGYVVSFNGNDARVLIQRVGENGMAWIDQIGIGGVSVKSGWNVAGVTAATKDHTLLRKADVKMGTTDWGTSAGSDAANSQWIVNPKNYFDNLGKPTTSGSDKVEIKGFTLTNVNKDNVTLSSTIDSAAATVDVKVINGADITALVPQITVSDGATILPKSGDTLDFTNAQTFVVAAQNGLATKSWTVTVTVAASASDQAYITSFVVPNSDGGAMIDSTNHTVNVNMLFGADLTGLTPEITVSAGATISPVSGVAQDFTNPVVYTVTAQDGTTTVAWTVTITVEKAGYVSIYDIQYTTDTSGVSPYNGKLVKTSGVVTALNVYKGVRKGYFIEDKEAAWNGVYVYNTDTANHVAVADSIEIVGTVDEYKSLTEIKSLIDFKNLGSGYTRNPVAVATGDASSEQWESVLAKFVNATCSNIDAGKYKDVEVNDGSGVALISSYLYQFNPFTVNDVYTVSGIVNYLGEFKLNPRDANDIANVTGISNNSLADNVSVYPNPGNGRLNIALNNTLKGNVTVRVMDMTGRVVYKHIFKDIMNQTLPVDISNEPSNLYFISISNGNNMVVKKFMKR